MAERRILGNINWRTNFAQYMSRADLRCLDGSSRQQLARGRELAAMVVEERWGEIRRRANQLLQDGQITN